jgi:hypothetical protein
MATSPFRVSRRRSWSGGRAARRRYNCSGRDDDRARAGRDAPRAVVVEASTTSLPLPRARGRRRLELDFLVGGDARIGFEPRDGFEREGELGLLARR